jgi:inosine-uridine nucleoside N-ribohydrolase
MRRSANTPDAGAAGWTRRSVVAAAAAVCASAPAGTLAAPAVLSVRPRARVIIDNDLGGDPDGLFQTAHHLMSSSVEVRAIVGSHLHKGEAWGRGPTALRAKAKAEELMDVMGLAARPPVFAGREEPLPSLATPADTPASRAIIAEAMRTDAKSPLYYCAGAGLTELAAAWLIEPKIAERMTLVWIGGPEYRGISRPPPGSDPSEYNLTIDIKAAQAIFGRSGFEIWQVPRSTYRQMLVTYDELLEKVRPTGRLGDFLVRQVEEIMAALAARMPDGPGETYVLGDSPLVTLTALQSTFQPDPSSSDYVLHPAPQISDEGEYVETTNGRPIRVYTRVDARLTFEDLYAKLRRA